MADLSCDENVADPTAAELTVAGHDVVTARQLRSKGIDDARQLTLAVRMGRVFVTYNRADFLLLHRAWRLWSHEWGVAGEVRHYGILVVPQPPLLDADEAAVVLNRLVRDESRLANRFFIWQFATGWQAAG